MKNECKKYILVQKRWKNKSPHPYSKVLTTDLLYGDIPGYMCIYISLKKIMHTFTKKKTINTIRVVSVRPSQLSTTQFQ